MTNEAALQPQKNVWIRQVLIGVLLGACVLFAMLFGAIVQAEIKSAQVGAQCRTIRIGATEDEVVALLARFTPGYEIKEPNGILFGTLNRGCQIQLDSDQRVVSASEIPTTVGQHE